MCQDIRFVIEAKALVSDYFNAGRSSMNRHLYHALNWFQHCSIGFSSGSLGEKYHAYNFSPRTQATDVPSMYSTDRSSLTNSQGSLA